MLTSRLREVPNRVSARDVEALEPDVYSSGVTWKRRFLRKKLKYMLICVVGVGIVFIVHQLFYYKELNRATVGSGSPPLSSQSNDSAKSAPKWSDPFYLRRFRDKNGHTVSLHGTRDDDMSKYLPNSRGKFVCFTSKEEIDISRVNDDYCDCPLDGSDEPGTNACNNGVFFCETPSAGSQAKIPSYRVSDGFCDCCDGSDEWSKSTIMHKLTGEGEFVQQSTKCVNKCK